MIIEKLRTVETRKENEKEIAMFVWKRDDFFAN